MNNSPMSSYPAIKHRLLKQITTGHDSLALSQRLGYSFNQVARWINGTKQCRWSEFWDLCDVLGLPLVATLRHVFALDIHPPPHDLVTTDDIDPAIFLKHLRLIHSHESIEQLARAIHIHPSTLKRYLRGDTSCDLDVVMAIVDLAPQRLQIFLHAFLGPEATEAILGDKPLIELAEAICTEPAASALEAALRLQDYQSLEVHSDEFIAQQIGVSTTEVSSMLHQLERLGCIKRRDDRSKKYEPTYEVLQMEGVTREQVCRFVRYWSYRSYLRLARIDDRPITKGSNPCFAGFRIAALSKPATQKIGEALRRHHQELISIMDEDHEPKTDVRVILIQDFSAKDILDFDSPRASLEASLNRPIEI